MTQRSHKSTIVLAALAVGAIGAGLVLDLLPASNGIHWLTLPEALTRAKESGKPVFLDVSASWCRPCKKMDQTVLSEDSIKSLLESAFVVARFNIDGAGVTEADKRHLDVEKLPSFVIFTAEGLEWKRSTGYMEARNFSSWIRDSEGAFVLSWPSLPEALAKAGERKLPVMVVWVPRRSLLEPTYRLLAGESMQQLLASSVVPTVVVAADSSQEPALRKLRGTGKTFGSDERSLVFLSPEGAELRRLRLSGMLGFDGERLLDSVRAVVQSIE